MQDHFNGRLYRNSILLLVLLYGIFFSAVLAPQQDILGWVAFFVGLGAIYKLADRWPRMQVLLLVAFTLRAFMGFLGYYFVELPEATADAVRFDQFAIEVSSEGFAGALDQFTPASFFWAWLLGVLYSLVGYSPLLALVLNVLMGTGVVLNVYLISRHFQEERHALRNAWVAALFPTLILYSAVMLREAGWAFFATLTVLLFVKWTDRIQNPWWLMGWLASGIVTGMFHSYGAVLLVALVIAAVVRIAHQVLNDSSQWKAAILPGALFLLGGVLVFSTGLGLGKVNPASLDLQWLITLQENATRGRAAFPEFLIIGSWWEFTWKLPLRILYLLFSPFPWMVTATEDLFGLLDAFLYLGIALGIALNVPRMRGSFGPVALLVVLAVLIVVASLTVGNYGTAIRHRGKLVALMIALTPLHGAWTSLSVRESTAEAGAMIDRRIGYRFAKRALDVTASACALLVLSPVLLVVVLLVLPRLGRPVLFRQSRGGLHGKPFTYLKFRTMTDDRAPDGSFLPDEERITRVGRFLRSTTLDELPSLWNVLRGDMSLVGPRPLFHHYVELYDEEQARRLDVRPGLTSWAVVKGRNALSWEQKFSYDVWYVDHRNMWVDLKILLMTVWLILTRKGVSQEGMATVENFRGSSAHRPDRTD